MENIRIKSLQKIDLSGNPYASPTEVISEAIQFAKDNEADCDLHYKGFTFGIEPDSDINQLTKDYEYWNLNK